MIRSLNLPECQQLWKKVKKQTLTDEIVSCVSKFYREKFPEVNDAGTTELEQSTPA
jgi:hypothetical protein